jgi:hypothetical protein
MDGDDLRAFSGSHCPTLHFFGYNSVDGLFDKYTQPGCPVSYISNNTVDPVSLLATAPPPPPTTTPAIALSTLKHPDGSCANLSQLSGAVDAIVQVETAGQSISRVDLLVGGKVVASQQGLNLVARSEGACGPYPAPTSGSFVKLSFSTSGLASGSTYIQAVMYNTAGNGYASVRYSITITN